MMLAYLAIDMGEIPHLEEMGGSCCRRSQSPERRSRCSQSPERRSRRSQSPEGRSPNVHSPRGRSPNVHSLRGRSPSGRSRCVHGPSGRSREYYLLVSLPPSGEDYSLLPLPPAGEERLLVPPPPAGEEHLLVPPLPLLAKCLLVLSPPAEGEQPELSLTPSSAEGEQMELPLPPPPAEGEQLELSLPPPLVEGEQRALSLPPPPAEDAGGPSQPLYRPLRGERRQAARRLRGTALPKDACTALPKDALTTSLRDAGSPSPGDADSPSPGVACLPTLPWVACLPASPREILSVLSPRDAGPPSPGVAVGLPSLRGKVLPSRELERMELPSREPEGPASPGGPALPAPPEGPASPALPEGPEGAGPPFPPPSAEGAGPPFPSPPTGAHILLEEETSQQWDGGGEEELEEEVKKRWLQPSGSSLWWGSGHTDPCSQAEMTATPSEAVPTDKQNGLTLNKHAWFSPLKPGVRFLHGFEKCLKFNPEVPIWSSKQRILCTLNQSLKDVLNYGLFQPAYNGKAGKFLDEERLLKDYPLPSITPVPYLEFRYKRRVYTQCDLDDKQLAKLHTKANLKKFMEYVQQKNIDKVSKFLEKGLDPNFHDPDTGALLLSPSVHATLSPASLKSALDLLTRLQSDQCMPGYLRPLLTPMGAVGRQCPPQPICTWLEIPCLIIGERKYRQMTMGNSPAQRSWKVPAWQLWGNFPSPEILESPCLAHVGKFPSSGIVESPC
ncbi:SHAN3 protein, partial [Polyodon spathula]|nr:SHAN3 protein [Polyodon spathula]